MPPTATTPTGSSTRGKPRPPRPHVDLPATLHRQFATLCRRNGVTASSLLYAWLVDAARAAQTGDVDRIPHAPTPPRGSMGRLVHVPWKQGVTEYDTCRQYLAAVGTDPTTVLRAAVATYVARGGNVLHATTPTTTRRQP